MSTVPQAGQIRLLSEVLYDGDRELFDGPRHAVLLVNAQLLQLIEQRCQRLQEVFRDDQEFYEAYYWFYGIDYYTFDESLDERERLGEWSLLSRGAEPDEGKRAAVECCQLILSVNPQVLEQNLDDPAGFEIAGIMVPKHADFYGKTQQIQLDVLQKLFRENT